MILKTFGNVEKPVIVLLHGGGLSWWSWSPLIERLQYDYYIITPILKGHGENFEDEFISIEDQAIEIVEYIDKTYGGKVYAIAGLSIGSQILCEILAIAPDICERAIIESALLYPISGMKFMSKWVYKLLYPLTKYKWFAKSQAKSLSLPESMIDSYFEDSSKMTLKSLVNMTISNSSYDIKDTISLTKATVYIIVGEKELNIMKKSANLLHNKLSGSVLYVAPSMNHGEFSICNSDMYVKLSELIDI